MRRPLAAAATAAAALWIAAPAAALSRQPFSDVTPRGSQLILCPAELGGGTGLAWLRFGETAGGRDVLDLGAAGVDPPTATAQLQPIGGCASTATTPAGATLITLNRTGFSEEHGRVFAFDRAPGGATGPPIPLSDSARGDLATGALASSGAALVAWTEVSEAPDYDDERTTVLAAARDAGGAFQRLGAIATPGSDRVADVAAGIDDAGYAIAVWTQRAPSDDAYVTRVVAAVRGPGGAFTAARELTAHSGSVGLSLVVGHTGEVLLAFSSEDGVHLASGTTRTGLGAPRRIAGRGSNVAAVLTPSGGAAVAWTQGSDDRGSPDGLLVSDRPAGGDFGAPHVLSAPGTRLAGTEDAIVRLAAAPDGRVLASWFTYVRAGDRLGALVPVAALRRTDGTWEPAVRTSSTCREPMAAFPGFDATGMPRVLLVDSGYVSAGDYGFPADTRVRLVRLGGVPATPTPPPKVQLTAQRRQVLRKQEVRLRVRCAQACDAIAFAIVHDHGGASSGLFPQYLRLRAGRAQRVALQRESYFDDTGRVLDHEGSTITVKLVVHACDSAGRVVRARRTIAVRIPRTRG